MSSFARAADNHVCVKVWACGEAVLCDHSVLYKSSQPARAGLIDGQWKSLVRFTCVFGELRAVPTAVRS
ncbi:hypothetical protein Y1Q_0022583 [Alligator mississippiensis]|uniref:Uncharacterized protein n=1 Tax=Alligator mississippiensis TaxID=8496 RepID=A0A151NQD9_ALLMI|nr:hypothetical protein Y1Q_0022583 [Alligator mississippiensis]